MKFLIVGFGSIGRRHFRNLVSLGERDIIFLRSKRSTLSDDEIRDYPVETKLESALQNHPDAVIMSNPTALHLDVAIPAAEAGCHLFLEKPISNSLDNVDVLETALERGGSKVFVGFQFRFHPGLSKIKGLLNAGEVGSPLSVRVHWGEYLPNWHPWEDYRRGYSARKDLGGGGVLSLCHPLDFLRWLFGEGQSIWAFLSKDSGLDMDVEDLAEVCLYFKNGVIGSLHLDYIQRPPPHNLEIVCSGGTIRWDNATGSVNIYYARLDNWEESHPPVGYSRNHLFLNEMMHFLHVINGVENPICGFQDGKKALELAMGIHHSAQHGTLVSF